MVTGRRDSTCGSGYTDRAYAQCIKFVTIHCGGDLLKINTCLDFSHPNQSCWNWSMLQRMAEARPAAFKIWPWSWISHFFPWILYHCKVKSVYNFMPKPHSWLLLFLVKSLATAIMQQIPWMEKLTFGQSAHWVLVAVTDKVNIITSRRTCSSGWD